MKLVKFNPLVHDINLVAGLIYETDSETFEFYFNNRQNAVKIIGKLVEAGKNNLGHENIYVVTNTENKIFGVLVISFGSGKSIFGNFSLYNKVFNLRIAFKLVLFDMVDSIFCASIDNCDLYLASVAVNYDCRGKGVGKFILKKSLDIAKKNKCKRAVLDVDIYNEAALGLYQKFGFKIYDKKILPWIGGKKGIYNMEFCLY